MRVILDSDFSDYYDGHFHPINAHPKEGDSQYVFRRKLRDTISRRTMFKVFHDHGLNIPKHGLFEILTKRHNKVVVYTDEYAHRGECKALIDINDSSEVLDDWNGYYASEFIQTRVCQTDIHSLRILRVGEYFFQILYKSSDSWRSNVGYIENQVYVLYCDKLNSNTKIPIVSKMEKIFPECPLLAIDFIGGRVECMMSSLTHPNSQPSSIDDLFAIDLNTSPSLDLIKHILNPSDVYNQVRNVLTIHNKYNQVQKVIR
jgi:hypothetical protein